MYVLGCDTALINSKIKSELEEGQLPALLAQVLNHNRLSCNTFTFVDTYYYKYVHLHASMQGYKYQERCQHAHHMQAAMATSTHTW
jgi:hypothetical protein